MRRDDDMLVALPGEVTAPKGSELSVDGDQASEIDQNQLG